jgi:hypothetical protein
MLPHRASFKSIPKYVLYKLVNNIGCHKMVLFLAKNGVLFENLPQEVLNKVVANNNYEMIAFLSNPYNNNSFINVPQFVLNKSALNPNNGKNYDGYKTLKYLKLNGVKFTFSQDILNKIIINGYYTILSFIIDFGCCDYSLIDLPQSIKSELLSNIDNKNIAKIIELLLRHDVSFIDCLSQDIINKIVIESDYKYELLMHFVEFGISFAHIPQNILNKLVSIKHKYNIVSILAQNGVSFTSIPQDILN